MSKVSLSQLPRQMEQNFDIYYHIMDRKFLTTKWVEKIFVDDESYQKCSKQLCCEKSSNLPAAPRPAPEGTTPPTSPWSALFCQSDSQHQHFQQQAPSKSLCSWHDKRYKLGFYATLCEHSMPRYATLKFWIAHHSGKWSEPGQPPSGKYKSCLQPLKVAFSCVFSQKKPRKAIRANFCAENTTNLCSSNWVPKSPGIDWSRIGNG